MAGIAQVALNAANQHGSQGWQNLTPQQQAAFESVAPGLGKIFGGNGQGQPFQGAIQTIGNTVGAMRGVAPSQSGPQPGQPMQSSDPGKPCPTCGQIMPGIAQTIGNTVGAMRGQPPAPLTLAATFPSSVNPPGGDSSYGG